MKILVTGANGQMGASRKPVVPPNRKHLGLHIPSLACQLATNAGSIPTTGY